jgi:hypothetical protein
MLKAPFNVIISRVQYNGYIMWNAEMLKYQLVSSSSFGTSECLVHSREIEEESEGFCRKLSAHTCSPFA